MRTASSAGQHFCCPAAAACIQNCQNDKQSTLLLCQQHQKVSHTQLAMYMPCQTDALISYIPEPPQLGLQRHCPWGLWQWPCAGPLCPAHLQSVHTQHDRQTHRSVASCRRYADHAQPNSAIRVQCLATGSEI